MAKPVDPTFIPDAPPLEHPPVELYDWQKPTPHVPADGPPPLDDPEQARLAREMQAAELARLELEQQGITPDEQLEHPTTELEDEQLEPVPRTRQERELERLGLAVDHELEWSDELRTFVSKP